MFKKTNKKTEENRAIESTLIVNIKDGEKFQQGRACCS